MPYASILDFIFSNLSIISLIIVGVVVEKHYVSRITTFTNSVALLDFFFKMENVHGLLWLYADVGFVMGLIGLFAYIDDYSLPSEYYYIAFFYNSIIVALIIILLSITI